MEYLETIQQGILTTHKCTSRHIKTIPVHLKHEGETMWEGEVELFELIDNQEAKRAYCWGYKNDNEPMAYAIVLELPPVKDAETAVKIYLLNKSKN